MSATITIRLKNPDTDRMELRTFWVCASAYSRYTSGYVYDTTDNAGTTGRQMSDTLEHFGDMATVRDSEYHLRRFVLRAQRRRLAKRWKQILRGV